ncbi:hypothetical protein ACIGH6_16275 [Brachybacterium paraconglomeratum]|uniref:hypothetical protein n=1 Tax=Brachybacterium paraconglomeratum TaxID=173362 RepID=UPI0037C5AA68
MAPKATTAPAIAACLHPARLLTYTAAVQGDPRKAIDLYLWNLRLAAAFQEVLALVEIGLRNALDAQLRQWVPAQSGSHSPEWLITGRPSPLSTLVTAKTVGKMQRQAENARGLRSSSHPRRHAALTHDDVLAQMTFGTLTALLPIANTNAAKYGAKRVLWGQALINGFPHLDTQTDPDGLVLADRVSRLHLLRNRVAHMEPLLEVNVPARLTDAYTVLGLIDPDLRSLAAGSSRVRQVLASDPRPTAPNITA